MTGRVDAQGEELPTALLTQHLKFSLPYRSLFAHGMTAENLPSLVDAIVVLLVRLHLTGFYWGDVSLSNVLFRRDAGAFAAYLVDAETGELRPQLSDQMRHNDVTVGCENIFAELLDLQASDSLDAEVQAHEIVEMLAERYDALWVELTEEEEFPAEEMWRIQQRIERLNELGFDVEELDIITDFDGDRVRLQPRVVELGHHQRELQSLTGMLVEDNQARRMLNDVNRYIAHFDLDREDRQLAASRWMSEIYDPIVHMVPPEARGKLEPAELFHEILTHRWYLSERQGARGRHLRHRPRLHRQRAAEEARRGAHLGARRSGRRSTSTSDWSRVAQPGQRLAVVAGRTEVGRVGLLGSPRRRSRARRTSPTTNTPSVCSVTPCRPSGRPSR